MLFIIPLWIRVIIEFAIIILILCLAWRIFFKYIICFCVKSVKLLNRIICYAITQSIYALSRAKSNKNNYVYWDEKIILHGRDLEKKLNKVLENVGKYKLSKFFKNKLIICLIVFLYVAIILPYFQLEKVITEFYISKLYYISNVHADMEEILLGKKEDYPEVFISEEIEQEEIIEQEEPDIYLRLDEAIYWANVRENSDLNAESLVTINSDNTILYLNEIYNDGERYWLKVRIVDIDVEGWLSQKVIDSVMLEQILSDNN